MFMKKAFVLPTTAYLLLTQDNRIMSWGCRELGVIYMHTQFPYKTAYKIKINYNISSKCSFHRFNIFMNSTKLADGAIQNCHLTSGRHNHPRCRITSLPSDIIIHDAASDHKTSTVKRIHLYHSIFGKQQQQEKYNQSKCLPCGNSRR